MKAFTIKPQQAWSEIYSKLMGEHPVDAVFNMTTIHGTVITIRADGDAFGITIEFRRDGTWEATYWPQFPEHLNS